MNDLKEIFNWKKNPANVFYTAMPLFLLGMSMMGLVAYYHWKTDGDYWYAVIMGMALLVLVIALMPLRHIYKGMK